MRVHGIPLNGLESGSRRVLILDADKAFRDALSKALTKEAGFEAMVTTSAIEAGAAVRDFKPHVLIVDVTLPDVTPRAIIRFVRSHVELQTTCLIGIGSDLSEAKGQALLQEGFGGYLSKPFDVRSLLRAITHACGQVEARVLA
jgi:DNA-binding response OmpR family regulator